MTGRNLIHIAREPLRLSDVTIQPVLFTLLYIYVLGAGLVLPDHGSYRQFAIARLLAMNLVTFLLFSYALSWGCACIGLFSRDAESSQGIGLVILFPLAIVSDALVPTQHMPAAIQTIADWNPVSAVTAASRNLFGNPNPATAVHAWPMQHPVVATVIWTVALLAVFAPLATWLYRTRTAD